MIIWEVKVTDSSIPDGYKKNLAVEMGSGNFLLIDELGSSWIIYPNSFEKIRVAWDSEKALPQQRHPEQDLRLRPLENNNLGLNSFFGQELKTLQVEFK